MENSMCLKIHELVNQLPEYSYKNIDKVPFNDGIYFLYEKGETYHAYKRIVRIGINRENRNFKERLNNHFIKSNHRKSIFLKHLGRVFLNVDNDNYIKYWDMKSPGKYKDVNKEKKYETKASTYIQHNVTAAVIEVKNMELRERLEDAIIATFNSTSDFKQSANWLGNNSPVISITNSGMWVVQGLNSNILTTQEYNILVDLIKKSK